jgi:hypothetical protein
MTIQDIVAEIPKLSRAERFVLLEAITQSLHESVAPAFPQSVVDRLYGAFRTPGDPLSDTALDQLRFDAIMEQHG